MAAIILSLAGAVVLYTALILAFRAEPRLPKPEPRCIVRNEPSWQAGKVTR